MQVVSQLLFFQVLFGQVLELALRKLDVGVEFDFGAGGPEGHVLAEVRSLPVDLYLLL